MKRAVAPTVVLSLLLVCLAGCREPQRAARPRSTAPAGVPPDRAAPAPSPAVGPVPLVPSAPPSGAPPSPSQGEAALEPELAPRPLRRCFPDRPAWEEAPVAALLDRAGKALDAVDDSTALACAEEAARQAPRSLEALEDRAYALAGLGRASEARDAITLALALAPDDAYTLETAANLYVNQLPPSGERSAIGLEYARRAQKLARRGDRERQARLGLLEAQALTDLGQADEARRRLASVLAQQPGLVEARFEHGVALFELCRFDEARRELERVVAADPKHAHAHYHLGLIAERTGDEAVAHREIEQARALDGKAFPAPPEVGTARFAERVRAAVAALPADMRADLAGVPVETAETPLVADLTAEKPPLSPTILGLFRGLPLGLDEPPRGTAAGRAGKPEPRAGRGFDVACAVPQRAIVLYRLNLLRTVRGEAELDEAIRKTLLHEIGHLRGEDDASLRDRGLE